MRIILPPSETKAPGGDGPPLDLGSLGFPELTRQRERLVAAVEKLAGRPVASRRVLGLSNRQDEEIERNATIRRSPTTPALDRYTGVLFDALDTPKLSRTARARAADSIVICSALFGALRADDLIPAYRLSATSRLPRLGTLASLWRRHLFSALAVPGDFVLDLRSGPYQALAPMPDAFTLRVIDRDGRSISHNNKAAKGHLVRAIVTSRRHPRRVDDVIAIAHSAGLALGRPADRDRVLQLVI